MPTPTVTTTRRLVVELYDVPPRLSPANRSSNTQDERLMVATLTTVIVDRAPHRQRTVCNVLTRTLRLPAATADEPELVIERLPGGANVQITVLGGDKVPLGAKDLISGLLKEQPTSKEEPGRRTSGGPGDSLRDLADVLDQFGGKQGPFPFGGDNRRGSGPTWP